MKSVECTGIIVRTISMAHIVFGENSTNNCKAKNKISVSI